jgi:acyl-CoA reductase-like NAD-dependent aldehyde dehydrogenase
MMTLFINGRAVEGAGTLDVVNPATGAVAQACARADAGQLNEAVAAAKAAFPAWCALGFAGRRARLEAVADALDAQRDAFARLLTLEQGKPLPHAEREVGGAIANLRSYASMQIPVRTLRENASERIVEQRTPLGVVAAIMPWNFPMAMLALKVGPALITGNTIVVKPAPTTPLTALLFCAVAGPLLPPGVLNIIVDDGDLGGLLTEHPDVDKISFTGSTATGKKVMASAAGTLKRLTLELGGNDAAIVLEDADIATVAPKLYASAMANSGQICMATKRVYAHSSVYEPLCDALAGLAREAVVDDGMKQGTTMGPLQNRQQFEKVKGFLEDARLNGKVIAGGEALDREGYFVAPTIVRDIPDDARLVREEQFGPILPVLSFDHIEDAIARANDSPYGLAGSVWTSDLDRGLAVAAQMQTGTVWINKALDISFDVPVRGARQSGMGTENGQEGLEEYTQARIVNAAL